MDLKNITISTNSVRSSKRHTSISLIHIKTHNSIAETQANSEHNSLQSNEKNCKVNFLINFAEVVKVESFKIYNYENNYDIIGALTNLGDPQETRHNIKNNVKYKKSSVMIINNTKNNETITTQIEKSILKIEKVKSMDKSEGLSNVEKKRCICKCQIY